MDAKNLVVLGMKGAVLAFRRDTGERVWVANLKPSSVSAHFVAVSADEARVFAHVAGEFFCLDLCSGRVLWHDRLSGYGYGLATIALPGQPAAPETIGIMERKRHDDAGIHSASTST